MEYVLDENSFPIVVQHLAALREEVPNSTTRITFGERRKLIVTGSTADRKLAGAFLSKLPCTFADNASDDCSICWTPAEDALQISCGHRYCSECFQNMCIATAKGDEDRISCKGDSGKCDIPLALEELKKHLTHEDYQRTLSHSLASYIRHRPDQYRHCPTKDCGQVYSVSDVSKIRTEVCLRCLNTICLDCHACHGRMSCQDWKFARDGGEAAFERAKQRLGVKDVSVPCYSLNRCVLDLTSLVSEMQDRHREGKWMQSYEMFRLWHTYLLGLSPDFQ